MKAFIGIRHNSKYGARKAAVDGIEFDSVKEAKRYSELKLLLMGGKISDLQLQVPFELIPTQREPDAVNARGRVIRGKVIEKAVKYFADFVYTDTESGERVVEDAKGVKTDVYRIKKKLMLYVHGIRVREV